MELNESAELVQRWQAAANEQNTPQVLELSHENIELVGPRGSHRGHAILADWLERAGAAFEIRKIFGKHNVIVVEQHGVWKDPKTREIVGESDVASRFETRDGKVIAVERYDRVEDALASAGLSIGDEYKS